MQFKTILNTSVMRGRPGYKYSQIKLNDAHFGVREGLSTESANLALKYTVD